MYSFSCFKIDADDEILVWNPFLITGEFLGIRIWYAYGLGWSMAFINNQYQGMEFMDGWKVLKYGGIEPGWFKCFHWMESAIDKYSKFKIASLKMMTRRHP